MIYKIEPLPTFKKAAKRLKKKYASFDSDFENLLDQLETTPTLGTPLGNGMRKIRMAIASKGKGKRGGARVITYTVLISVNETEIDLVYVYDKSEREDITEAELREMLKERNF